MWRKAKKRRFAVLVHGKDLLIRDDDGSVAPGGVYTWRCLDATTADEAVELAIRSVVNSDAYSEEVDALSVATAKFVADDVVELTDDDQREGTGFVFYLNTDSASTQ